MTAAEHGVGTSNVPHPDLIPLIQFYSIEVSPLADGRVFVGITATLCEDEGDLSSLDMGTERVATLDEVITVIRLALAPTSPTGGLRQ